jgi:hypothetical protein
LEENSVPQRNSNWVGRIQSEFLVVIRKSESELLEGFEKSERGIVERD